LEWVKTRQRKGWFGGMGNISSHAVVHEMLHTHSQPTTQLMCKTFTAFDQVLPSSIYMDLLSYLGFVKKKKLSYLG
jgi:hypothetical protein